MKFELPNMEVVNFELSDSIADIKEDVTIEPGAFDSSIL